MPRQVNVGSRRPSAGTLSGTGFARADIKVVKRQVMSVEAEHKCGKTRFGLTCPRPLGLINLDDGLEGVADKHDLSSVFVSDLAKRYKAITEMSVGSIDAKRIATAAGEIWNQFRKDFLGGIKQLRTVVIDSGTEMHELIRLARFGRLTQVMPHHYGPVNAELALLLRQIYDTDCNLIILHRLKQEYAEQSKSDGQAAAAKPTGRLIRAGFSQIPYIVQTIIRLNKDEDGFHCKIEDCRHTPDVEGFEIDGDDISFSSVAQLAMPSTTEGDWV